MQVYAQTANATMLDDKNRRQAAERFRAFLAARHKRCTGERFAILDAVMATSEHFSIEAFGERLEAGGYHVSVATLYNTFQLLCEAGLLRRHKFEHKSAEYERVMPGSSHTHLICTECGAVREVREEELADDLASRRYRRFKPAYFSLYVYGVCGKCERRNKTTAGKTGSKPKSV